MAQTSLTYNFANIDVDKVIKDAFAQCGKANALISGWEYTMANQSLNFLLTSWLSKKGLNLFTVEQDIIQINPNQNSYLLPLNTSKILECTWANAKHIVIDGSVYTASNGVNAQEIFTSTPVNTCSAGVNGWVRCTFPSPQPIQYVGILVSSDFDEVSTLQLDIQCSFTYVPDPKEAWITVLSIPSQVYYPYQTQWFSLPFTQNARSWRIIERGGAELNLFQVLLDIPTKLTKMGRVGRDVYTFSTNNTGMGNPTTCYMARSNPPTLNVFQMPSPQTGAQFFVYNRVRSIQDAGDYTNTLDMTPRFLEAVTTGLAARLSRIYAPDKTQALSAFADELFLQAAREDTENVDMQLSINQQGYVAS
jgi:hypothetical protein